MDKKIPAIGSCQLNIPILLNRPHNPLICICIPPGMRMTGAVLRFTGTVPASAIHRVNLVLLKEETAWESWEKGEEIPSSLQVERDTLVLDFDLVTRETSAFLWVLIGLVPDIDLSRTLSVRLEQAFSREIPLPVRAPSNSLLLRLGYRLRHAGDDGAAGYRIPGLATTNAGTLLAVYDVRRESSRDLQGDIDIGLSRSTDGGHSWEPMRIVLDMGIWGGLPEKYNGVSDPCIAVDRVTGHVFVFACWMHGLRTDEGMFREDLTDSSTDWAHQWHSGRQGSGPGMGPRETSQFLMTRSIDDGRTWSEPVRLTPMLKEPDWFLLCPAPGNGITTQDGTLVVPAQGRMSETGRFSTIAFSRDHGKTWELGTPAQEGTNECAVAELDNGELMLNMRDPDNRRRPPQQRARGVSTTRDLGATWKYHSSDHCPALLPEPVCMGSLFQVKRENQGATGILLFANPDHQEARKKITIKASFDGGISWPRNAQIELDELQGAGYSCMTKIDAEHIGILYESSQGLLVFQKIEIANFASA